MSIGKINSQNSIWGHYRLRDFLPEIVVAVAALALAIFAVTAFFKVGMLSLLPNATQYSCGAWCTSFAFLSISCVRPRAIIHAHKMLADYETLENQKKAQQAQLH